jgi:hypothetical protein
MDGREVCTSPDVIIQFGKFERPGESLHPGGVCLRATQDEVILSWKRAGAIQIRGGKEVLVDPYKDSELAFLQQCIIGPVFAVLLHQKKHLILHASAVSLDGEAVIFLGNSGDGKSTIAASLLELGHQFLADDIVAVQTAGVSHPLIFGGFPHLKLWPDATGGLEVQADALSPIHPDLVKKVLRDSFDFKLRATSLRTAYILRESDAPEPRITPVAPQKALVEIVRYSFLARLLDKMDNSVQHFEQASSLVNRVPIRFIKRRKDLSELRKVARLIEEDICY